LKAPLQQLGIPSSTKSWIAEWRSVNSVTTKGKVTGILSQALLSLEAEEGKECVFGLITKEWLTREVASLTMGLFVCVSISKTLSWRGEERDTPSLSGVKRESSPASSGSD
jgi:hypothetical protein